ncbi:MAG: hypothetical protein AAB855_00150, partial [Patescibacteria group bacterium]
LLETVLYIAIAAVMLLSVIFFFLILLEGRTQARAINEVEQQGLHAMEIITSTIRNAENITSPTTGSSASSLALDVVSVGNDPTVFDFSSGALRITEGAGSGVALTSSHVTVSTLTFSNYSRSSTPGTIRIQFTLTYVSSSTQHEYTYAKTFISSASLREN